MSEAKHPEKQKRSPDKALAFSNDNGASPQDAGKMLEVLKNILNGMDAYVYVSDMVTDEIFFINNRMKEAFGLDDSAVGKTCWKVLQDGFTERCSFCPNIKLAVNPNVSVVWEEHNTVTKRHYKNVDSIIEWMDGKKVHMQHSADITDIIEAQGETLKARERLEIALTSSQAGVWELDFNDDLLTYDVMCARLFGLPLDNNVIPLAGLISHLEQIAVNVSGNDIIKGLRHRDPYASNPARDFYLRFPDGSERYLRNYGNTIRDSEGRALRVIGMCIDITQYVTMENDLKAARDAAENASRAKSQFLSNMSHEIRTPMNAIIGMTEILLNEKLSQHQSKYLRDMKTSATSLLGIINDILDFSKIEAGKLQLAPVDYDLSQLLYSLESMFTFAANGKGIVFTLQLAHDVPQCLYGDDLRVRQVLVNILGNAIKFTEQGRVSLQAAVRDNMLRFTISDTGIGIKEEDLPNIFNDFDQLDMQSHRHIGGTGLGLSITRSLVAMMGGNIQIESQYGVGTSFYLNLPLVIGDKTKLDTTNAKDSTRIMAPSAQILVVDDNEVNLNVAAGLLALYGINCDTASSGQEAIAKIAQKQYDIVFMDHMMPEMDGVETTRVLRASYSQEQLVIIALTANAIEGVRDMLLDAQMNDYLSKPIERAQLSAMLQKWLPADKLQEVGVQPLTPAGQNLSPLLQQVGKIGCIDVALGLDRISGMQDIYEKSLAILARRLPETVERLASFLHAKDLKAFAIEVHGVKGSLNNIGATQMALAAEALELEAKKGDMAFCQEKLPALNADLLAVQRQLAQALAEHQAEVSYAQLGDKADLMAQLPLIRELLDSFDGDSALEILQHLGQYDYGAELNNILKDMSRLIEEFEYNQAIALVDKIIK